MDICNHKAADSALRLLCSLALLLWLLCSCWTRLHKLCQLDCLPSMFTWPLYIFNEQLVPMANDLLSLQCVGPESRWKNDGKMDNVQDTNKPWQTLPNFASMSCDWLWNWWWNWWWKWWNNWWWNWWSVLLLDLQDSPQDSLQCSPQPAGKLCNFGIETAVMWDTPLASSLWFTIAMPSQISRPYARRLENYIEPASFLFNHHISSYIDEPWRPWRHHFADLKFESISPKAERLKNGSQGSRKVEHLAEKMLVSTAHIGLSENVVYRIPQNGSFYRENYDKHDKP